MSITAMKLALEALKYIGYVPREDGSHPIEKAITALRNAIAEAEACEPVEFQFQDKSGKWYPFIDTKHFNNTVADGRWPIRALYVAPQPAPKQEPVAWYDEEMDCAYTASELDGGTADGLAPLFLAAGATK